MWAARQLRWRLEDVSGTELDELLGVKEGGEVVVVVALLFQQLTATTILQSPDIEMFMQLERLCSVPLH